MPSITITGRPGHGKTYVAVWLAHQMGRKVLSDVKLNGSVLTPDDPATDAEWRGKILWDGDWKMAYDFACGTWLADEIGTRLDARKYDDMPAGARRLIILHRHKHISCVFTVQLSRLVDVIYREMSDEIWKVSKHESPFVGWFDRKAIRKALMCPMCGEVDELGSQDEWVNRWKGTYRRVWWKWLLGYGTQFRWTIWEPEQLDARGEPMIGQEPLAEEKLNYDPGVAALYDTHGQRGQIEGECEVKKNRAGASRPTAGDAPPLPF